MRFLSLSLSLSITARSSDETEIKSHETALTDENSRESLDVPKLGNLNVRKCQT